LLTVTPQMLIDYFKPVGDRKLGEGDRRHGEGVSVEVPVPFLPATPSPTVPSKTSYQLE
jgi:hypothetical protein